MTGIVIAVFVFFVAADQATKLLLYGRELALIPGVVGILSPGELNRGMAWGMLSDKAGSVIILSAVTILTCAILAALYFKYRRQMPGAIAIALAMILGGAVGNLIDRIVLGGVRDFIHTEFMEFPIFNVADIGVTCGGILLAVTLLLTKPGHRFAELLFADDKKKKQEGSEER